MVGKKIVENIDLRKYCREFLCWNKKKMFNSIKCGKNFLSVCIEYVLGLLSLFFSSYFFHFLYFNWLLSHSVSITHFIGFDFRISIKIVQVNRTHSQTYILEWKTNKLKVCTTNYWMISNIFRINFLGIVYRESIQVERFNWRKKGAK